MANWQPIQIGDNLRGLTIRFDYPHFDNSLPQIEQTIKILETQAPNSKYITGIDEVILEVEDANNYTISTNILTSVSYTSLCILEGWEWADPIMGTEIKEVINEYTFPDDQDYIVTAVNNYYNSILRVDKPINTNEIKGIANNGDSIKFLTPNTKIIPGSLHVTGNVVVKGKVSNPLKIVDFSIGTDIEIKKMLEAHYAGEINIEDYWHVGDTRKIHLNGINSPNKNKYTEPWPEQDITIVITALNHHDLKEQIGTRTKAAITIQTKECLNNLSQGYNENGCVFVNLNNDYDTTFKKWSQLPLRTWMNGSFLTTCFSSEWQNIIKETKHKRLTQYDAKITEEVIDKLFLPSYPEIFGNTSYSYYLSGATPAGEEGTQWDYYKTSSNRVKKGNNNGSANSTSCYWWESSASSGYDSSFGYCWCGVSSSGSADLNLGHRACGLAPAFCL